MIFNPHDACRIAFGNTIPDSAYRRRLREFRLANGQHPEPFLLSWDDVEHMHAWHYLILNTPAWGRSHEKAAKLTGIIRGIKHQQVLVVLDDEARLLLPEDLPAARIKDRFTVISPLMQA